MTDNSIKKMNESKTLLLTKRQTFWHYFLALVPLGVGLFNIYWLFNIVRAENYKGTRTEKEIFISIIIWISFAIIVFVIKKRRLNFKQIDISLSESEFKERMVQIAKIENWNLANNTKNFAIFYNGSNWTWGLQMTILKFEKYILVNSICDPDKGSLSIFNENTRNIKRFEKHIKKPVANTV